MAMLLPTCVCWNSVARPTVDVLIGCHPPLHDSINSILLDGGRVPYYSRGIHIPSFPGPIILSVPNILLDASSTIPTFSSRLLHGPRSLDFCNKATKLEVGYNHPYTEPCCKDAQAENGLSAWILLRHTCRSSKLVRSLSIFVQCEPLALGALLSSSIAHFLAKSLTVLTFIYWTAHYLTDLRSNRPLRPSGSRPLPAVSIPERNVSRTPLPPAPPPPNFSLSSRVSAASSKPSARRSLLEADLPPRSASAMSHYRSHSMQSTDSSAVGTNLGRPLVRIGRSRFSEQFLREDDATVVKPSGTYLERGDRWMERQEAHSLSEALHDMDTRKDESLHTAAQDEASRLVWEHQNPNATTADREKPYRYRDHLRKGSHARAQSAERCASLQGYTTTNSGPSSRVSSGAHPPPTVTETSLATCVNPKVHELWDSPQKKAYMSLTNSTTTSKPRSERRRSSRQSRNVSGGSLFRNPADQIYEEPEEMALTTEEQRNFAPIPPPLKIMRHHSAATAQSVEQAPIRANTAPVTTNPRPLIRDGLDFAPRQSRNPAYTTNQMSSGRRDSSDSSSFENYSRQDLSLEIRSDDIRQATSMRAKDRSSKLPTPEVVSDKPGRPIVSFDPDWKQNGVSTRLSQSADASSWRQSLSKRFSVTGNKSRPLGGSLRTSAQPPIRADSPLNSDGTSSIPTFNISESSKEDPFVAVGMPSIVEPGSQREIQKPIKPIGEVSRPWLQHAASAPVKSSTPHYTLSGRRPTACCAQCQLPIAGRIVSAAGERFHPECFICFNCGEGLECVAFYPEPEQRREARIDRIRSRSQGIELPDTEGQTQQEDGDESLRFFCHLDFHELFSPRCRSCKTPIEGEVIVACGGEWHVGHFFCAECGDVSLSSLSNIIADSHSLSSPPNLL